MKNKIFIVIITYIFILFSCTKKDEKELIIGKWELLNKANKKHLLIFDKQNWTQIPYGGKGKWSIHNSKLYLYHNWIGNKDTLHFNIRKLTNSELIIIKTKGGSMSKIDTLNFGIIA